MIRKRNVHTENTAHTSDDIQDNNYMQLRYILVYKYKFYIALAVRLSSVFIVQTYFVPDEYWQSSEIAHRHVFQYGYLTWEWIEKIRSYFYPAIFEIYFSILKFANVDYSIIVIYGPHFIQAIVTAFADVSLYYVSLKLFNNIETAIVSFLLNLCSWFIFFTGSRTLSNTAEMCCTCIALSFFSFETNESRPDILHRKNSLFLTLLFGGISCIIRPTSFVIWIPLMLTSVIFRKHFLTELFTSTLKVLPIILMLLFGVDYYFYKEFVITHWNFAKFNIFQNLSGFYGSHPFHWYVTQGLPVVMSLHLLMVVVGVYYAKTTRILFYVGLFYIFIHSLIAHKEFRFLLPVMPLFMSYAGYGLKELSRFSRFKQKTLLSMILMLNVIPALYFSLIHQRGVIDVIKYIKREADWKNISVLYLMPCHSTPFYSHIHHNISMRFLTCHPSNVAGYVEEAGQFYTQPESWFQNNMSNMTYRPTHVITFDVLPQDAQAILLVLGYKKTLSFFHTHFPEGRVGSYVDVYTLHGVT